MGTKLTSTVGEDKKSLTMPKGWDEVAHALLHSIGLGIYVVQEGKFVYVNPAFQKLTGYAENELLDKYSLDLVHSEDREMVRRRAIENLKSQKSRVPYEYRLVKKNGEAMWVLEEVTSIHYAGKRATAGFLMDITARKQLEETIKDSEERYRTILNEMQDGYFEVDLGGHVTFANNAVCQDLGYSAEELIGMSYKKFTFEEDIEPVFRAFNEVYRTGVPSKGIYSRSHRKDGSQGFYETSVALLRNNKGEPIGFRCVGRDITKRKEGEEKLRQSRERYKALFDSSVTGTVVVDAETMNIMVANQAALKMFGFSSAEEGIGANLLDFVPSDERERVLQLIKEELFEKDSRQAVDLPAMTKDGRRIWINVTGARIAHEGKLAALISFTDITERRRAEEALKESEEKYRSILDEIGDAYFEVDLKGNFTFVNDQMSQHLQYSKEELLGMNYRTFTAPEEIQEIYKAYNEVYRTGQPKANIGHKIIRKDGSKGFSVVSISPVRNEKGEVVRFRGISRDITERKRLEEEREALLQNIKNINQKLEEANKELQDFVYIASHDLREPLRKISSFGTLLEESLRGKLDEDQRENLEFMIDGARRMQNMIDALLTYSRLTTKAKPFEWVNLNEVVEDVKKFELAALLEETQGAIHIPKPLPSVQADPIQMHQLFQNLIGNGLKFHKEGVLPEVTIRAYDLGNHMIRIEVEDNGIGIDEKYHSQLFTMFRRLHTREQYEGTGIGLAVCKKIVERHGGSIGVRSKPGEGSTFWFTLPKESRVKEGLGK